MPEFYTPRAAAEKLGISYPTIKQWLYRGKLRGVKTPGGHYRIHESEIDYLIRNGRSGPARPRAKIAFSPISGRNQLTGKVIQVRFEGLMAQVKLAIDDQSVTAVITADAARQLDLRPGVKAAALIKSTDVMIVRV